MKCIHFYEYFPFIKRQISGTYLKFYLFWASLLQNVVGQNLAKRGLRIAVLYILCHLWLCDYTKILNLINCYMLNPKNNFFVKRQISGTYLKFYLFWASLLQNVVGQNLAKRGLRNYFFVYFVSLLALWGKNSLRSYKYNTSAISTILIIPSWIVMKMCFLS